jgi:hypothetical protein
MWECPKCIEFAQSDYYKQISKSCRTVMDYSDLLEYVAEKHESEHLEDGNKTKN